MPARQQQEERQILWYWRDIQVEDIFEYPTEEPPEPQCGERWYDPDGHCLCIWDGIEWVSVPLD